jgi:hypothetical protein
MERLKDNMVELPRLYSTLDIRLIAVCAAVILQNMKWDISACLEEKECCLLD